MPEGSTQHCLGLVGGGLPTLNYLNHFFIPLHPLSLQHRHVWLSLCCNTVPTESQYSAPLSGLGTDTRQHDTGVMTGLQIRWSSTLSPSGALIRSCSDDNHIKG